MTKLLSEVVPSEVKPHLSIVFNAQLLLLWMFSHLSLCQLGSEVYMAQDRAVRQAKKATFGQESRDNYVPHLGP